MKTKQDKLITPHQDINEILTILPQDLTKILGNNLVGVYLTDSLTYGDFDRGSSDIDLLVVLRSSISDEQRKQIKDMHVWVARKYPFWTTRIECSYITQGMLASQVPPLVPRPYVNGGHMWDPDPPYGNEWLINLYALYHCGISLLGPTPQNLLSSPVSVEAVRNASKNDFYQEWVKLLEDSSPLKDSHFQVYVILTLCRILYRHRYTDIVSKKVAAAWVKESYGKPWESLIKKAETWQHGQEMDAIAETLKFIEFVAQELEKSG
jgi:hypothetical protein